ncbi:MULTISPECIES: hypothetical protein [Clostridia]|uniref:hypothetical protein n=1 Tax=Clostridia TaxID=186801 RepID=UPI00195AC5BF|nr:hypothetical protein [Mordavella massiliensis]
MALRIPWDKQETALLIDAYLRVKGKELSQQEAIKEVSTLLRCRAILSGIEIDEVFRNENGISMQMKIVGGLVDEKPSGLHNATKMFAEMVALYKNRRSEFDEILIQAKGECTVQVNIQENFFAWLSSRVSSAQLSEFYIVCKDLEAFCLNKHILAVPLFETTDFETLQYVKNTIQTNKMFQFKYFRQIGKMKKVMEYYLAFLRENPVQKAVPINATKEDAEAISTKPTEDADTNHIVSTIEEVITIGNENAISESNNIISTNVAENKTNTLIWNFANERIDFTFTIPIEVSYFDEKRKCHGWQNVFVCIIEFLQEDYPAIIRGMVGYYFAGVGKVIFTGRAGIDRLSKAEKINDGLYLETDCTPDEIVTILHLLMSKCNMDYDNIEIIYEKKQGKHLSVGTDDSLELPIIEERTQNRHIETENRVIITSVYEGKSAFENWLISGAGLAERSAQSYSSAVNVAGQYSVRLGFSEKELYFILDAEQVYQINMKLLANPEFAQLNESQHNRYRAALSKYWDYCNALAGGITIKAPVKSAPEQKDEVTKTRIAFIAWAQEQQMQKAAILAYLSDINKCSEFAKEHDYIKEEHFLLIEDANVLERIFWEMRKDSRFVEFINERQKRPISAMNKLIAFRRATGNNAIVSPVSTLQIEPVEKTEQRPIASEIEVAVNPQVKERYTAILAENFVDGFRPGKAIDRNRFRMYYFDMFGQELTEEDEQLVHTLIRIGSLRDERIYVKDDMEQKDLIEEINETIMETFKEGASCIYLDCLFEKFQEELAEILHVYNVNSLESILFSSQKRNYFKRYNYLFGYNKEPAPAKDVIEYMKKSHLPVIYSEIESSLWYIPLDKIKHTLVTTPGIVNVAPEAYLYAPNLPVSGNELQKIAELISHALLQRSYISDVELMQLIEEHCPSVLMNTPDYPMWGLRNALAYLLRERFSFRGAIISDKDEEISMAEVFSDFCQQSEHITVEELKKFANELNTVIYWDSVYGEMVRINQNEFIRRDQIHFNVEQTDAVLDSLVRSEYTPIKNINLFLHFPTIDVPWNNFVLESYVANYSKKFRLLHASYAATDCCGAMVRQESGISDYRTLIVDVLSKNTGWKTKKDALQLLVDLGYQQRRSYSDIEKVMQEAKIRMSVQKK